jgi:hypothetical protein
MKARAAAARARKKHAGTQSTRAAVRRLDGSPGTRNNVQQEIKPKVLGKNMSKKKVRSPLRGTQSQTHHASVRT